MKPKDKGNNVRKLLTCSTYLAVLAIVSTSHAFAACSGGGFHAPVKSAAAAATVIDTTNAPLAEIVPLPEIGTSLDSARFDSMSSRLDLSKGQSNEISHAKSEINDEYVKLTNAQSKAQYKLDNCGGNCVDEKRNLARSANALKNYNANDAFELRLRSILHTSQAETYFRG